MAIVKRHIIGRRTRNASRVHNLRNNEQRRQRLVANRVRISTTITEEPIPSTSGRRQQSRRSTGAINYERLAFRYEPTVDYAGDESVNIGTMTYICQYCNALKFLLEPSGLCCANGKVKLPQLTTPPEPLNSSLLGHEPLSKHFLQNIQNVPMYL
ncbi:PREDICTED: uncharacterized protein LOC108972160 [Bactrocera latifrons]|uniref:uncharacterized protein LOC108972160 n=1 Tax=Bactrocera latifrons TaxID=174628 RepID=UPI0008DCCD72|nr:PREDICTED: uncharacterized protein LOC108972160 [Bactrocera latifrons]